MYKNLILFRNELKNKVVPNYKIIGIVSELLLSKKIFPKNIDIEDFLKDIFGLELKSYLFKSRSLIVSKVIREIKSMKKENTYKRKLYKFIEQKIEELRDEDEKKQRNDFDGWI